MTPREENFRKQSRACGAPEDTEKQWQFNAEAQRRRGSGMAEFPYEISAGRGNEVDLSAPYFPLGAFR
jgi:hypothetical protein